MAILKVGGGVALSPFRLDKLNAAVRAREPRLAVGSARFWHFVEVSRDLDAAEHATLVRLLTYGARPPEATGRQVLVTPRLGTISPWSSKATDIARQCGLAAVRRVERGTMYDVDGPGDVIRVLPFLHDRMTETVVATLDEADELFHHYAPN